MKNRDPWRSSRWVIQKSLMQFQVDFSCYSYLSTVTELNRCICAHMISHPVKMVKEPFCAPWKRMEREGRVRRTVGAVGGGGEGETDREKKGENIVAALLVGISSINPGVTTLNRFLLSHFSTGYFFPFVGSTMISLYFHLSSKLNNCPTGSCFPYNRTHCASYTLTE